jgi:hypothetical protein
MQGTITKESSLSKPQASFSKRQREQAKRDRQKVKAEKKALRKTEGGDEDEFEAPVREQAIEDSEVPLIG